MGQVFITINCQQINMHEGGQKSSCTYTIVNSSPSKLKTMQVLLLQLNFE